MVFSQPSGFNSQNLFDRIKNDALQRTSDSGSRSRESWATDRIPRFRCGPLRATSAACLLLQLRLEIREVKVLSV